MIQPYVKEASHFVTGVICSHAVLHGKLHVFETEQKTKSTLVMKNMLAESVLAVVGLLCRIWIFIRNILCSFLRPNFTSAVPGEISVCFPDFVAWCWQNNKYLESYISFFFFTVQYNGIFLLKFFGQKCFSLLLLKKTLISNVWENTFCPVWWWQNSGGPNKILCFCILHFMVFVIIDILFTVYSRRGSRRGKATRTLFTVSSPSTGRKR